jgi:CRP-like cAMP-binding protein
MRYIFITQGAGFGDLALVNDKPRTASIVTATKCQLVLVEKIDYNRILKVLHVTEQMEKMMFLKKLPGIRG